MSKTFARCALLVLVLAVGGLATVASFGRAPSASAALDLSGDWTFTVSGDFEGVCSVALTQTGENISGDFSCPSSGHEGTLDGTVKLQGQTHVLNATVTFHSGSVVLDVWHVTADVLPAGNNASGSWQATSGESGSMDAARDVPSYIKGDLNCDGLVDERDVLTGARATAQLDPLQETYCPTIGSDIGVIFGDIDCNGLSDLRDAILVLRRSAGLPVSLPTACLAIGETYTAETPSQLSKATQP